MNEQSDRSRCTYSGCNHPEGECSGACLNPHDGEAAAPKAPIERALATQVGGGHYKDMAIQPVEYIYKNGIGYFEGCVIKYVSRWKKKNGIEDLKKARHFIDLLIEMEEAKP